MAIDSPAQRMYGRFDHRMDDKSRIIIPERFRANLGENIVLTQGPTKSMRAYSLEVWFQLETAFSSRDAFDEYDGNTQFLQRMIGNCEFVSIDAQHRITVPRFLKEWAGLSDEDMNTIIGTGLHIEFWKKSTYTDTLLSYSPESVDAAIALRFAQRGSNGAYANTDASADVNNQVPSSSG